MKAQHLTNNTPDFVLPKANINRTLAQYLFAFFIVSLYGIKVCPFIDSLPATELMASMLVIMTIQFLTHLYIDSNLVSNAAFKNQTGLVFKTEFVLFLTSGTLQAFYNIVYSGFPLSSGLKLLLGFAVIGFFVAIDLALEREYRLSCHIEKHEISLKPDCKFFTLVKKFILFSTASIISLVCVLFLLVNKQLGWLEVSRETVAFPEAQRAITVEFSFVGITMLIYMLTIVYSYSRNIKHTIDKQNLGLKEVTSGKLNNQISISTNDEFGTMAHHTNVMIRSLKDRTDALQKTQDVTILSLASMAEIRDNETGAHILRTQRYVKALALNLRSHPRFSNVLDDDTIELLYKSAPLHDIGKIGIPDTILLKPGKLSEEEFRIMQSHTILGGNALKLAEEELGGNSFLSVAREVALNHHEKWDGTGYPKGLKGDEIPVSGRLMAVADVYDALITKRVYKPAYSHKKAQEIILQGRGKHFDPDVVDAFILIEHQFKQIAEEYSDNAYAAA